MINRVKLSTGRSISSIAWGLGSPPADFDVKQATRMLEVCIELGVTTIDNAENYGGYTREKLLGDAIKNVPGSREKVELVTKCGCVGTSTRYPEYTMYHYDSRKQHILEAVDHSLTQMGTDYLDALLLHRFDPLMNAEEVAEAFDLLHRQGKVLEFGVSNFSPLEMELLQKYLRQPLVMNETQFSSIYQAPMWDGTFAYCQKEKIRPLAWGPLGRGALFTATEGCGLMTREEIIRVGEELGGATVDQVALAWVMTHPSGVIPILGTGVIQEMISSTAACNFTLKREHWFRITNAGLGHSVP